jgi:hypothetical protein
MKVNNFMAARCEVRVSLIQPARRYWLLAAAARTTANHKQKRALNGKSE